MGSLKPTRDQIYSEYARLVRQWYATGSQWNDAARLRFEKEFWQEYEPIVRAALDKMELLDRVIEQARREVK